MACFIKDLQVKHDGWQNFSPNGLARALTRSNAPPTRRRQSSPHFSHADQSLIATWHSTSESSTSLLPSQLPRQRHVIHSLSTTCPLVDFSC
ncbi:hypothetical protein COLO4_24827 [Corchorus olitorius]|uniref:Uncharacterized protein n=1 Tax=Corchorus olitorius TaxID=93759 RepID=A0A1R3I6A0_9ROSI|nr:hypothetical protein COLO4_24827 [Corchorus olitorius]